MAATIACNICISFLIETHPLSFIERPYADNSELSYTTTLSYTMDTILPELGTIGHRKRVGSAPLTQSYLTRDLYCRWRLQLPAEV